MRRYRQLLRDLAAVKPTNDPIRDDWAEGAEGQRVLARILAERRQPARATASRGRFPLTRVAAASALLLFMTLGAGVFARSLSGPAALETPSMALTSSTYGAAAVARREALRNVVALIDSSQSDALSVSDQSRTDEALLRWAQAYGLVEGSDSAQCLGDPTKRKDFVVWLWRGLRSLIQPIYSAAGFSDLAILTPEEATAVQSLTEVGILTPDGSSGFRGYDTLTLADQDAMLARAKAAVEAVGQ